MKLFLRCILVLCALLALLSGCVTEMVAEQLVTPPNLRNVAYYPTIRGGSLFDESYTVRVGPPLATLRYFVIHPKAVQVACAPDDSLLPEVTPIPGHRNVEVRLGPARTGPGEGWFSVLRYGLPAAAVPATSELRPEPLGTVILLSGHSSALRRNPYLLPFAGVFADAGYRVVVVEQRGHGDSTGHAISYGVWESQDLSQVIDDLEDRRLLTGRIGVFGHSMGAAVAIQAAAVDPRIDAVIAVAPFASLHEEVKDFASWKVPYLRWLLNDAVLGAAVNRAGKVAGFDARAASPVQAIRVTNTPVLLMHGDADDIVPVRHSRMIKQARPQNTRLVVFRGADHWSMMKVQFNTFRDIALDWMQDRLNRPADLTEEPIRAGLEPVGERG